MSARVLFALALVFAVSACAVAPSGRVVSAALPCLLFNSAACN